MRPSPGFLYDDVRLFTDSGLEDGVPGDAGSLDSGGSMDAQSFAGFPALPVYTEAVRPAFAAVFATRTSYTLSTDCQVGFSARIKWESVFPIRTRGAKRVRRSSAADPDEMYAGGTGSGSASRCCAYVSVAAITALMVCIRFSASSKTMDWLPSNTVSVTSMQVRPNFSRIC